VLPLFVRKFIVDFIETGFAAIAGLALVIPNDLTQAKDEAVIVGVAILGALVSAIRRDGPDFFSWLQAALGYTPDSTPDPTPAKVP